MKFAAMMVALMIVVAWDIGSNQGRIIRLAVNTSSDIGRMVGL